MSRSSPPVLTSLLLLLLLPPLLLLDATVVRPASTEHQHDIGCSLRSCVALDVAVLQEYVRDLNDSALGIHDDIDPSDFSSVELLPFGALSSDWSRLLLLQNRQPEGSLLYDNLLRLSRVMLAAYFDSEDRLNWEMQFSTDDYGENVSSVTVDNPIVVSYTEFQDQQASNVTFNSTARKGSTWFNTSFSNVGDTYNNEKQARDENWPGNEDDSTTTSYYAFSNFTIGATNFNRTFSTADNETSGNKSNETFADSGNEDESSLATTRTFKDSFASSSPQPNELEGDKNHSSSFNATGGSFASSTSSDEESSENSSANEAVHERSKENFVLPHFIIRDDDSDKSKDDDDVNSRSFSALASDERIDDRIIKSVQDVDTNHNKNATNPLVSLDHDVERKDSEELLTQSIENFFTLEDESNRANVSNFGNSTDSIADEFDLSYFTSWENENTDELLTKSIEDFFASAEDSNNTATMSPKVHNESEEKRYEENNETDTSMKLSRNITNATEISLKERREGDEITNEVPFSTESNKVLEEATEKWNRTVSEESLAKNTTFIESIANIPVIYINPNMSISNESVEDFYKPESTERINSLDFDKLISPESSAESRLDASNSDELNSTNEEEMENKPSTLAELIFRSFSGGILAATTVYSNEITSAVDSTGSLPNGTEDRSAKYPNISSTISSSLLGSTMDQDKVGGKARILGSELDEGFVNRTTDLSDYLFRKTPMERRPEDDWSPTTMMLSIERTSSDEEKNASLHILRDILMINRHGLSNNTPIVTKLRKIEDFSWNEDEDEDYDEGSGKNDSGILKNKAFNLSLTSSKNQYKRSNGIDAEAKMNKRKSRKRAGAELSVERQYRTFLERGSRQTQFAEKKVDEDIGNQGTQVPH